MAKFHEESPSEDSSDDNSSDEELRDAFRKGILKPGLNVQFTKEKALANNVVKMKEKLDEMMLDLPWVERLDMTNDMAPLAPELAVQIERQEQKRENLFKNNKKITSIAPNVDPVLNDFKREIMFYRQAQAAVIDGIVKLKECGISTKRPDDYFAEMAKTDDQMQKIRKRLTAKQDGQQRSERVKQLREQRKMSKIIQREVVDKKQADKNKHMNDLKAFRKGKLKNLDFLNDDKNNGGRPKPGKKRQDKDKKYGRGGKKKGSKRNTKESTMDTSEFSVKRMKNGSGGKPTKGGAKGGKAGNKNTNSRMGKGRRQSVKSRS